MKKIILLLFSLLVPFALMAQETAPAEAGDVVVNVNTFNGMMALVTVVVTALVTKIDFVANHKWAKVLSAIVVGIAATMACWVLQVSDYLSGLVWWQALVSGAAVGLSSCGFYDVIKALWTIFKPKTE